MKSRSFRVSICAFVVVLLFGIASSAHAQLMDTERHVDTLSIKDRIALRTNFLDWAVLVPNIGVEYDLYDKNWSRLSVGLNLRYNWNTPHTYTPGWVYNIFEAKVDIREYWHTRPFDGRNVKKHDKLIDKLFSLRRPISKHPTTTYYRGGYISYGSYSLRMLSDGNGHQGQVFSVGGQYGILRPLFHYQKGGSLNLDLGVSAGVMAINDQAFRHDKINDNYYPMGERKLRFLPAVNELRLGLVYRFGNYPYAKRYRYRYDADIIYRNMCDSIYQGKLDAAWNQHYNDSMFNAVWAAYEVQLDSVLKANPKWKTQTKTEVVQHVAPPKQKVAAQKAEKPKAEAEEKKGDAKAEKTKSDKADKKEKAKSDKKDKDSKKNDKAVSEPTDSVAVDAVVGPTDSVTVDAVETVDKTEESEGESTETASVEVADEEKEQVEQPEAVTPVETTEGNDDSETPKDVNNAEAVPVAENTENESNE